MIRDFAFMLRLGAKSVLRRPSAVDLPTLSAMAKLTIVKYLGRKGGKITLLGYRLEYADFPIFYDLFREIFIAEIYKSDIKAAKPVIIDAGANIGLASLFFRRAHPKAAIQAFEPDPANFALLQKNVTANNLTGIHLHNLALSDTNGKITLYTRTDISGNDIGASIHKSYRQHYHKGKVKAVTVPTATLSSFISGPVDLLKIDVEGAEGQIFSDLVASSSLTGVKEIRMEFHYLGSSNPLSKIVSTLEDYGFTYAIDGWASGKTPEKITHCIIVAKRLSASRNK